MNYTKTFLLFLSISLFSQPILLHAEESIVKNTIKAAGSTIHDSGKCALYYSWCATQWGLKKIFDHDLYSILLTTPASEAHIITTDLGTKILVDSYPAGRDIYATATINPYQNVESIVSSKVFHGLCLAGGMVVYASRCYHQKERRDQILRQASNWQNSRSHTARTKATNQAYALANQCYNIYIPLLKNNTINNALNNFFNGNICYDDLKRAVDPTFYGQ